MSQIPPTSLHCTFHPERETLLRCNRCDRPICAECAIKTPTGYRCRECVKSQQKVFETAQPQDYLLAIVVAGVLSFLGSLLVSMVSFFILLLAPVVGVIIAEAVRRVVKKRRSRRLFQIATAAVVCGSLPVLLINLLPLLLSGGGMNTLFSLLPFAFHGLYTFLVASSFYYRFTGIRI